MFGFGKKKKEEKKHNKLDKLIMGAIVGGAVGSVIGMTIAPQKGKDTREMIAQKGKELIKKGQDTLDKYSEAKDKKALQQAAEELLAEEAEQKKSFLARVKNTLFGRDKKVKKNVMKDKDMQKIPYE